MSDISEIKLGIDRANREMYDHVNRRQFADAIVEATRLEFLAMRLMCECQRLEREARK